MNLVQRSCSTSVSGRPCSTGVCVPHLWLSSPAPSSACPAASLISSLPHCQRLQLSTAATSSALSSAPAVPARGVAPYFTRPASRWPTTEELGLRQHNLAETPHVDLVVAGAGPAGAAVAERVAAAGFSVCVVDPNPTAPWPNNYGVWVDEFQAMGLEDCLQVVWPKAKVWLSGEADGERFLNRPYGRVDRPVLKRKLLSRCAAAGVTFLSGAVDNVTHGGGRSSVKLSDGRAISGSLVLDATGHSRKLVRYDKKFDPGYQGAYGIIAEVESHPFDLDTMLFMDWRDDHTQGNPSMQAANRALPTFLYAMPFSKTKIFLEETSLVARPAIGFEDLKQRMDARLKWLGIKVTDIEEEEYCLIPMGGVLPTHPQRVLGIGGTAGMVHPSTGFMVSRALGAAPLVADAIVEQLSCNTDKATDARGVRGPRTEAEAEAMAAAVWRATWPVERIRQRAFNTFGMDVLLALDLQATREFFAAFFSMSDFHWHGFLSTRLNFPNLLGFGVALFFNACNEAKLNLVKHGVPGAVRMMVDLAPTVGQYYADAPTVRDQKAAADKIAQQNAKSRAPVPTLVK